MRIRMIVVAAAAASLAGCAGSRLRGGCCAPTACASPAPPPCAAPAAPCAPAPCPSPCAPPPEAACACAASFFDAYVPVVPVPESRLAFSTLIMPSTPFLGTEGSADTPRRGGASINLTRINDERRFRDERDTQFALDGELQVVTLEWVSPRQSVNLGCSCVPFHVALSVSAYTDHPGLFDWLRDFVEEEVVGQDAGVAAAHNPGGREISATSAAGDRTDFANSTPMWKAKGVLKFPLPDFDVHGRPGRWSASLGITAPAFGENADSGNDHVVPEVVLAAAVPLSERWRLTGAASFTVPGRSRTYEDLGIDTQSLVWSTNVQAEWWASCRLAFAFGFILNGPFTRGDSLPSDHASLYGTLGALYRVSDRVEVHLLAAENPGTRIVEDGDANSPYDFNGQVDADFSISFGASISF